MFIVLNISFFNAIINVERKKMVKMYNYNQSRMDSLMQQKQMIEQQIQTLQQYQVPPININNNIPSSSNNHQTNYDGNFKWVDGEEQAKQIANNNLPLILFDNNNPIFYMKNVDGSFKKFTFSEVIEEKKENMTEKRIDALEGKINDILNALVVEKKEEKAEKKVSDKK